MKHFVFDTTFFLIMFSCWMTGCQPTQNKFISDWHDSISCEGINTEIRISTACDKILRCDSDSQYDSLLDTIATLLLTPDMLEKELSNSYPLRFDHAADKKAMLMTVDGLGRYCTGTSYVLYKKDDNTCSVKKVAYSVPSKHGGPTLPAQFYSIERADIGYKLYGKFSFNDSPDSYQDTLYISKEFLESDVFIREYDYNEEDEEPIFVIPK